MSPTPKPVHPKLSVSEILDKISKYDFKILTSDYISSNGPISISKKDFLNWNKTATKDQIQIQNIILLKQFITWCGSSFIKGDVNSELIFLISDYRKRMSEKDFLYSVKTSDLIAAGSLKYLRFPKYCEVFNSL